MLHNVGAAGSFTRDNRIALAKELAAIEIGPDDDHPWKWAGDGQRVPGMQSRWTGKKDMGFHPIQPILVAEVKYDHMQGDRFRHVASFVRWRPDRETGVVHLRATRAAGEVRRRGRAGRRGPLMAKETFLEVARPRGAGLQPGQGLLPGARVHEAAGRLVLRSGRAVHAPVRLDRPTALERWPDGVHPGREDGAARAARRTRVRRSTRSACHRTPPTGSRATRSRSLRDAPPTRSRPPNRPSSSGARISGRSSSIPGP